MDPSCDLRAGPWRLRFVDGDLRDLTVDGVLVVQRIYAAVRDEGWRTVGSAMRDVRVERDGAGFRIAYVREFRAEGVAYDAAMSLVGSADGRITVAFSGTARSAFRRNRIGLCVLHDQGLAGRQVVVRHGDGSSEEAAFPALIAPHQPFHDVAALTVRTRPGRSVTTAFAGEGFETEDQRNWGDASFKTYSTPHSLPRPVAVAPGDVVNQRVELSVEGPGLALAADHAPAVDRGLLAAWGVTRLRAVLAAGGDPAPLRASPLPLDLVLRGPPAAWPDLAGLPLASVVAVPDDGGTTPTAWVQRLRERFPGVPCGGGHATQFTDFNRGRPDGSGWDVVDLPVDPYVHAEDEPTLHANVPALAAIAASARAIMPGAALHLALAHGRHPAQAGRHGGVVGTAWLARAIDVAGAAGVAVLGLGPAAWLPRR